MTTVISDNLNLAIELIKRGEIVALPSETVYGLAGDALSPEAIAKIFEAKNRPRDNPLILHVSGIDMIRELGLEIPPLAAELAAAFWAGALTMVLNRLPECVIPAEISCGLDSVAVRVPNNAIFLEVIRGVNRPLAAPSANLSGSPSPTKAEHVRDDLQGRIPLILDGGPCQIGIESTVIAFDESAAVGGIIRILRPGAVTAEMLREFGAVVTDTGGSRRSPGTRYRHYSPKAQVIAVEGDVSGMGEFVIADPDTQTLFAKFREFDKQGAERIYVRLPAKSGVGTALYNRIMKAAGDL